MQKGPPLLMNLCCGHLTYDIIQLRRKEVIKGLKVNSVGKIIKHLKSFLKDRMRKKIIPFMDLGVYKVMA